MNTVISVEVPEGLHQALEKGRSGTDLPRWALEAMIVAALRQGLITEGLAGHTLGLSFDERERFLSEHGFFHDYSDEEMNLGISALADRALAEGTIGKDETMRRVRAILDAKP